MDKKYIDRYKKAAIDAAYKAGNCIRRSVGRIEKISFKGDTNLVTDVDKKSESIILKMIQRRFPDHGILSEETPPKREGASHKWIIDPLDGTTNFAHSFPIFSVSIALEIDGEMACGVVYDPMRDELFYAQKGRGAFLNKRRLHVSMTGKLKDSLLVTGFAYDDSIKIKNLAPFKTFLSKARGIRRTGSAAIDLSYVASGRFDGFWEFDLKPWDSAAGELIVREALGCVTTFNGTPHLPYDKEILASNTLIHKEMISTLKM